MAFTRHPKLAIFAGVVALVGLVLLIVGIVLLSAKLEDCPRNGTPRSSSFSTEARRSGLDVFLKKVRDTYYELHPQELIFKPGGVKVATLKEAFRPYDPSPTALKKITDAAKQLLKDLEGMEFNHRLLRPREKKAITQVKHYLASNFATPYDGDYYAGDFLMGPNLFCWQPICSVGYDLSKNLPHFKPQDLSDVELLRDKLKLVRRTFVQYAENVRYGIKSGMTRSVEECRAGIDSFKGRYLNVSLKGDIGIYDEYYMAPVLSPSFLSNLTSEQLAEWKSKKQKTVDESIREYALKYVGKPIQQLFSFLETEYLQHCVPSLISSGLGSLPLSHVFVNGTRTYATTKKLPSGEPLDGKKAYSSIMPFFTTTNQTPDEVYELGFEMLRKLYPEVLEIARAQTNQTNNDTARDGFIRRLNQSDMYFADEPIPRNESDENAHKLCSSTEGAQKYCPKRWKAMQNWFAEARQVMSMLDPKTSNMFYFSGPKHTAPNCPVDMAPNFNPSFGAQSYRSSNKACTTSAYYNIPFFLNRPGPKYEEWSVNAHEARPGHHTQVQGLIEHFQDTSGDVISWLGYNRYTAFSEGWALYAENPLIARDTTVYDNEPFQKYGMLKWQVWRALRLIVDTGLHYKGLSRDQALGYFATYAWDTSDAAEKEVTRYQSDPGQATAYMIGQLKIMELRKYAQEKLGDKFNLKDFHFYLLAQGSAPLSFLEESIREYVSCTLGESEEGCEDVLNPVASSQENQSVEFVRVIDGEEYVFAEKLPREEYM